MVFLLLTTDLEKGMINRDSPGESYLPNFRSRSPITKVANAFLIKAWKSLNTIIQFFCISPFVQEREGA